MRKIKKQIGEYEIEICSFDPWKAGELRAEVASFLQANLKSIDIQNMATILPVFLEIVYKFPPELCLKLFSQCYTMVDNGNGIKGTVIINNKEIFNTVFDGNLDGINELVLEVINHNGFFSMNIISQLRTKLPKPVQLQIENFIETLKKKEVN